MPEAQVSYWESTDKSPVLAQIIKTKCDQGNDMLHINLYLSNTCTTEIYYALHAGEPHHYVLTNTAGKVIHESTHLHIKKQKKLQFNGKNYRRISAEQYFADMKKFESRRVNKKAR